MRIVYYEPYTFGIFSVNFGGFDNVSEIESVLELEEIESPNFLLLNPTPSFNGGWDAVGEYAGDNPGTKILVNAIGAFGNVDETAEKIGHYDNVEVLGFRDMMDRCKGLLAKLE